jgi:hypothetical protein
MLNYSIWFARSIFRPDWSDGLVIRLYPNYTLKSAARRTAKYVTIKLYSNINVVFLFNDSNWKITIKSSHLNLS